MINLLGNPYHELDQLHEGASVALVGGNDSYIADGWVAGFRCSGAGVSIQRVTANPPPGITANLLLTMVAGASMEATDYLGFHCAIEALELAGLGFGSPAAQALILDFQARSSIAPYIFAAILVGGAPIRSYPAALAITEANVWQRFTVKIPGDTTGSWPVLSTAPGAYMRIGLAAGSPFAATPNEWISKNIVVTPSATNTFLGLTGATFEIADASLGVQPILTKRGCLSDLHNWANRYFFKSYDPGTPIGAITDNGISLLGNAAGADVRFNVPTRVVPTVTLYSPRSGAADCAFDYNNNVDVSAAVSQVGTKGFCWHAAPAVAGSAIDIGAHFVVDARFGALEAVR